MKSTIAYSSLILIYTLIGLLGESYDFIFLFLTPILVAIFSYELLGFSMLLRRLLAALVPVISYPIIYFLGGASDLYVISLIHVVCIGLVVFQIYEALRWVIGGAIKSVQKRMSN